MQGQVRDWALKVALVVLSICLPVRQVEALSDENQHCPDCQLDRSALDSHEVIAIRDLCLFWQYLEQLVQRWKATMETKVRPHTALNPS